jgi:ubiquinone/menaquinone biosynthesis C-methylase UbiE
MANKEHWEVDPFDMRAMWLKVISEEAENAAETQRQAQFIFEYNGKQPYQRYGRCLEIGAGVGRLLLQAGNYYGKSFGVDSSTSLVAMSTLYLRGYNDCRVLLSDGLRLQFLTEYFNFVYSFTCFQHMEELETIQQNLREAFRVLMPGGICRIQTVCGDPATGRFDGYVFPSAEAFGREFMQVGFRVVDAKVIGPWIWVTAEK